MEKVNVNKMDANKLKDAMRRMDEFKFLYENGVILQEHTKEEFFDIYKEMYIDIVIPLLGDFKYERSNK